METNLTPAPAPVAAPQTATPQPDKNPDGTNFDGTVTITLNRTALGGEVGVLTKGASANVSVAYADAMQDTWLLASRSDVPNYEDPSKFAEAKAIAVAKTNFEAQQKRKGK